MILLFCGFKGSGKDECTSFIQREYCYEHYKISKYLKEMLKLLFGFSTNQLEGSEKETIASEWDVTPREVMKYIGTNLFQFEIQKLLPHIERDFWMHLLYRDIKRNRKSSIVISDLRFLHELDFMKRSFPDEKIIVVKVVRDSQIPPLAIDPSEDEHTTLNFDYIIPNNSSIQDLHINLRHLIETNI